MIGLNSKIEVKTFNLLSEALREYNKDEKIKSIPSKEELDTISKAESQELNIPKPIYGVIDPYPINLNTSFIWNPIKPASCPNCGKAHSFNDGSYFRSAYGGLSLQYICKNCGYRYDTGKSFE